MTEKEWLTTDDTLRMVKGLPQLWRGDAATLEWLLHQYYLACCRAIWKLLPQEGSRYGVEVAERFLAGEVSEEELNYANRYVEGVAFNIDYNCDPTGIEQLVEQTRSIPEEELRGMLHPPEASLRIETRELLKRAAYFADYAMLYHHVPKAPPGEYYAPFLSADLLRKIVGNPFRSGKEGRA